MTSKLHPRILISFLAGLGLLAAGCAAPATPSPTPTAVPPTRTSVPPTATDVPASPTAVPSTPTRAPATATATSAPATETGAPATATGVQASATPRSTAAAATSTPAPITDPFTPRSASMFETAIGQDTMTGTCTGGPILPAYGLVVITPAGDSLTWDDQEPGLYTFFRTGTDAYYYTGPTGTGEGSVNLTLQFTAADRLVMQRVFTPTADPACQHTHNYTGEFQWLMP